MKTTHKQILALLLALVLLLSLRACAQKMQTESDEPKMSTAGKKLQKSNRKKLYCRATGTILHSCHDGYCSLKNRRSPKGTAAA